MGHGALRHHGGEDRNSVFGAREWQGSLGYILLMRSTYPVFEKVLKEAIKAQYMHKGIRYLVCQLGCMKVKTETYGGK